MPPVEAGQSYQVHTSGASVDLLVDASRVDSISILFPISPASLTLHSGKQQVLALRSRNRRSPAAMLIEITTDVLASR